MKKIPTLFVRDPATHQLTHDVHPDAAWVMTGEGVATRKFDGTPVLIQDGRAYKRVTHKGLGAPPAGWFPAQEHADKETGEWPGWIAIGDGPEDAVFREVLARDARDVAVPFDAVDVADGTFELIGPKVNGNPEGQPNHFIIRHGVVALPNVPRFYEGLIQFLSAHDMEGIVWHHPDGRMAKIKAKDFGIKRPKPVKP